MTILIPKAPADDSVPGPAMAALNERQRAFVEGILNGMSQTDAYIAAGYSSNTRDSARMMASKLAHTKSIQDAILEGGHAFAGARIKQWLKLVEGIAEDPNQSGVARLKALDMLLSRGGSIQKSETVIKHEREMNPEEWKQRVLTASKALGIDPTPLLAKYDYVDASFDVVADQPATEAKDGASDNNDASADFLTFGLDNGDQSTGE